MPYINDPPIDGPAAPQGKSTDDPSTFAPDGSPELRTVWGPWYPPRYDQLPYYCLLMAVLVTFGSLVPAIKVYFGD